MVYIEKKKKALDDIVYEKLKNGILRNNLPPNYQLVESEIAKILNVSRTPVHTALKLLERDGLIAIVPNKGACVTRRSFNQIKNAFTVRVELEKLSVRLAAEKITDDNIRQMENILAREKQAYEARERAEAYEDGANFHILISKITENDCLINYINEIIIKTDVYNIFYVLNDPELNKKYRTPGQHRDILYALAEKDTDTAVKKMEEHIESTKAQLNLYVNYEVKGLDEIFR
ncbi:GntR family transcriptional regulator [Metallumcola ferriviriculae]|uniref:GntR family transcriptional regulator n=1 Tax=Metallumcola ferriviriculae TaxID=3039180 RepID=A0AAU0UQZ8_9FIRM|nr:GntR family transcriptional regulator [Desulfitibacteraceae bacterium MK1]